MYGDYFTLFSYQILGYNYQDADLRDGGGTVDGAGNWNDTIEATWFVDC